MSDAAFLVGPALCKRCHKHVFLDRQHRWCDKDGLRHACGWQHRAYHLTSKARSIVWR